MPERAFKIKISDSHYRCSECMYKLDDYKLKSCPSCDKEFKKVKIAAYSE